MGTIIIKEKEYPIVVDPIHKRECYEIDCIYYDKETHLVVGTSSKYSPLLLMAKAVSNRAYENKYRKTTGVPYSDHCTEIYRMCSHYKFAHGDDVIYAAAVLHDYLEDAVKHGNDQIETIEWMKKTFGYPVANIVVELTNAKKNEDKLYPKKKDNGEIEWMDKTNYVNDKMSNMGSKALFIKLLDMLSNLGDAETCPDFVKRIREHIAYIEKNKETVFKDALLSDHFLIIDSIKRILRDIYKEL